MLCSVGDFVTTTTTTAVPVTVVRDAHMAPYVISIPTVYPYSISLQ